MVRGAQRPFETRARNFERVATRDRVVGLERGVDDAGRHAHAFKIDPAAERMLRRVVDTDLDCRGGRAQAGAHDVDQLEVGLRENGNKQVVQ